MNVNIKNIKNEKLLNTEHCLKKFNEKYSFTHKKHLKLSVFTLLWKQIDNFKWKENKSLKKNLKKK